MGKITSRIKTLLKKVETTIDNSDNKEKEYVEEVKIFDITEQDNIETINVTEISKINDKKIDNNTIILTRIYCDDITLEEIDDYDLAEFNKEVLKIAYYDKQKRYNSGLTLVKQLKTKYKEKPNKTKILNNLQNLMTSKKGFFDSKIYSNYLYCTVDSKLSLKIFEQKKQDEIFKEEIQKLVTQKSKKEIKKETSKKVEISTKKTETISKVDTKVKNDINVTFTGNNINSRHSNNKQSQKQNESKKQEQFVPIKTYFEEEILEIGKILYVEMQNLERQKDAITAWDKLEVLINKDVNDKEALIRMINLLERINKNCDGVLIDYDKNKCMKLLEKKIEIKN